MMKFTLASRHKEDGTRERYFYEWSIMHVALMITGPHACQVFKRYVQHFAIAGVSNDELVYPLSDEGWESFAEHWVDSYEDMAKSVHSPDYVHRMQPHRFGSSKFITSLSNFEVIYQQDGFRSGGVKLVHFLKKQPGVDKERFNQWLRAKRAPAIVAAVCKPGLVRKYVQDMPVPIDPAVFKGTLFEAGSIGLYAGLEEFWFESVEDLVRLRRQGEIFDGITSNEQGYVDAAGSISMVVNERVVWDFVTPGETTPRPAVLDPETLEAYIDRQGYGDFDKPKLMRGHALSAD
jgi:hypothetical protein